MGPARAGTRTCRHADLAAGPATRGRLATGPNGERPLTLYAHAERVPRQEKLSAEDTTKTRTMTMRLMQSSRDSNLEERIAELQSRC